MHFKILKSKYGYIENIKKLFTESIISITVLETESKHILLEFSESDKHKTRFRVGYQAAQGIWNLLTTTFARVGIKPSNFREKVDANQCWVRLTLAKCSNFYFSLYFLIKGDFYHDLWVFFLSFICIWSCVYF